MGLELYGLGNGCSGRTPLAKEIQRKHGQPIPGTYSLNRSRMACFMTCPPTSEMDFVSGMSFGQISTQFWVYPHSWMPPSPIKADSRSRASALPVGCVLKRRTCEMAAAPTNPVDSLNCGHASMQQQHEMQRDSG